MMAAVIGSATEEHADQIAPSQLSASRIEFSNGSRIIAPPGASESTVRGYAKPADGGVRRRWCTRGGLGRCPELGVSSRARD